MPECAQFLPDDAATVALNCAGLGIGDDGNVNSNAKANGLAMRLRDAVRAAGGNQAVASRSGVPLATVNNYVRGRHGMKIEPLAALAAACGVSLQWLVTGDTPQASGHDPAGRMALNGFAEPQADLAPDAGTPGMEAAAPQAAALQVTALAKAIEIVRAVAGDAALQGDATAMAARIAAAYAVLVKPPSVRT